MRDLNILGDPLATLNETVADLDTPAVARGLIPRRRSVRVRNDGRLVLIEHQGAAHEQIGEPVAPNLALRMARQILEQQCAQAMAPTVVHELSVTLTAKAAQYDLMQQRCAALEAQLRKAQAELKAFDAAWDSAHPDTGGLIHDATEKVPA